VTIYDVAGEGGQRGGADTFNAPGGDDLRFYLDGTKLYAWPHFWSSRGVAAMPILPADDNADRYRVSGGGQAAILKRDHAPATLARQTQDAVPFTALNEPGLVRALPMGDKLITARPSGLVRCDEVSKSGPVWQIDLNKEVPRPLKPWVANA